MTSTLSRGDVIRKRCGLSLGLGITLSKFVKDFGITDDVVKMMYNSVIHPAMVFGLKGSALTKSNRSKIRRYETHILRTMRLHSKKTCTAKTVREFLDGKTVTRRIRVLRASYFGHIHRRPRGQHAYHYKPVSRKTGRPCITWLDNLHQDRTKYDFPESDWISAAGGKKDLKTMAEAICIWSVIIRPRPRNACLTQQLFDQES